MKKFLCTVLAVCLTACLFSGCTTPDSLQMDLFQGYGRQLKLIHLNASSTKNRERMEAFAKALSNAEPLEKDVSMFAYYPDYIIEINGRALTLDGDSYTIADTDEYTGSITAVIDINGDWVDFYFPGPEPEQSNTVYRSNLTAKEFKKLVHQVQ